MKKIAIFASGSGTNAEAIARHFQQKPVVEVAMMICNRKEAGVYDRMKPFGIPSYYFPKAEWTERGASNVIKLLEEAQVDLVVLAGFLAIIPAELIAKYPGRIINIHPALLPKHGGKGMWGMNVHNAVLADGDKSSGITIHKVSEEVDGGEIIFQASCDVLQGDTAETLATRVHGLEHKHFPTVVEEYALSLK